MRIPDHLLPWIGAAGTLLVWQAVVSGFGYDNSILPGPLEVARGLWRGATVGPLITDTITTLRAALIGLFLGTALAFVLGAIVAESRYADVFIYPVMVWLQSMPIVAIAPLLIVWFGIGIASKIAVVTIAIFFPMFINIVAGLKSAPADLVELYRGYGSSRLRLLADVRLPSALPYIFAGLQVAVTMAIMSCVVGEFLAARAGLGFRIRALGQQLDLTGMFAQVAMLAFLGVASVVIVGRIRQRVIFWQCNRH